MMKSCQIAIIAFAALVAVSPYNFPPLSTVTVICRDEHSFPASSSVPITSAPHSTSTTADGSADYMMISITNVSKAGDPAPAGIHQPPFFPIPCPFITKNIRRANTNLMGSKIEGSITGPPDIDVSHVDGYSVPIICSSEGIAIVGCNIELFKSRASHVMIKSMALLGSTLLSISPTDLPRHFFQRYAGSATFILTITVPTSTTSKATESLVALAHPVKRPHSSRLNKGIRYRRYNHGHKWLLIVSVSAHTQTWSSS